MERPKTRRAGDLHPAARVYEMIEANDYMMEQVRNTIEARRYAVSQHKQIKELCDQLRENGLVAVVGRK